MPLPVFGTSVRDNNNCGNSFIGTRYFQKYPAPGRYETGRTTLNTTPLSRSRTSDWTRRYRNTRSMEGTQAMLSLGGADRVGEKVGPAPGSYEAPPDSFAKAMSRRNTWTAAFAGRMSHVLVLKDIHIYGRGLSAVPDEWEPLMSTLENPLERNHKGPVGKI